MENQEKKKKKSKTVGDYFSDAYTEAAKQGYLGTKAQTSVEADEERKKKRKKQ